MSWLDDAKKKRLEFEQAEQAAARQSKKNIERAKEAKKQFWQQHKGELYQVAKDIAKALYGQTWLGRHKGQISEMTDALFGYENGIPNPAAMNYKQIVFPRVFLLSNIPRYSRDIEYCIGINDTYEFVFGKFKGHWGRNPDGLDFYPDLNLLITANTMSSLKQRIAKEL